MEIRITFPDYEGGEADKLLVAGIAGRYDIGYDVVREPHFTVRNSATDEVL